MILDVIYNHLGPNDLAVWQFDGWFQYWNGQDMGGIYFYNDWRAFTDWGEKNRPHYGRPEVRAFLRDNALMWLEEYQVDGMRPQRPGRKSKRELSSFGAVQPEQRS